MQVSEVMHKGVSTVQISDSIKKVAALMKREDIGAVPVYKNERPVGFVTDRDIVITCVANGQTFDGPISHAMSSRDIIFVYEHDDVNEAVRLMEQNQISRLLVLDQGGRPCGMLTLKDVTENLDNDDLKSEIITTIKRH